MIYIDCSSVASFCGKNKYVKQEECFINVFKKNNEDLYYRILNNLKIKDKNEKNSKITNFLNIKDSIEKSIKENNREHIKKKIDEKIDNELRDVPSDDKEIIKKNVKEHVDNYIKTEIGKRNENIGLDKYEKKEKIKVTNRNQQIYYCNLHFINETLKIGGKIDGVHEDKIVEHKQRLNRLFDKIPIYEQWQLMLYMYITGTKKSILVQSFKNEQKTIEFNWSDKFFEEIKENIEDSLKKYIKLISNPVKLENTLKKINY